MTVQLTAADFKHMIDIAVDSLPGSYVSRSFNMSTSNYWIDEVCKNLDSAINDAGTKRYFLVPDIDTFRLNLDELYFGWQDSLEQNYIDEESIERNSLDEDSLGE